MLHDPAWILLSPPGAAFAPSVLPFTLAFCLRLFFYASFLRLRAFYAFFLLQLNTVGSFKQQWNV